MSKMNINDFYQMYGGFWRFPDMLDFCYLVNPYFAQSGIIEEMQTFFPTLVSEYPSGMRVNSELAGECWGIKPEYVIPGNGAAELIKELMEDFDGMIGVIRPTFEEYPNRLGNDKIITFIPTKEDFRYDAGDIIAYFSDKAVDTIILINPDNPSGNFIPKEELIRLAIWTKDRGIRFVLDESFVDFSNGYDSNSCICNDFLEAYPQMCVLKSISKSYGIPGLRLGILCSGDTNLISKMKKRVSIWNINSFAEFFMQIYPKYRGEYKRACDQFIITRDEFEGGLRSVPYLHVMPSQANFFFLEVLPPYSSVELCSLLLERYNILASACLAKKGIDHDRYIRVAVRNHEENQRLIVALHDLV